MVVFHDLNLSPEPNKNQLKRAFDCAARLGYDTVAVGYTCTEISNTSVTPQPPPAPPPIECNVEGSKLKQLSRLTVVLREASQTNRLKAATSKNVHSYDILAVQPTNAKMFHLACTDLEVDIISVKMTERLPFFLKAHPVSIALSRGVHFEISYVPAIKDSTLRRYVLSNAISITRACRGRNIIITSTANNPLELRGPHDVANLGILFGMSESQARDAVQSNGRAVLLHAAARKSIRSSMGLQQIEQLPSEEAWKVKAGQQACGMAEEDVEEDDLLAQRGSVSKKKKKKQQKRKGAGGDAGGGGAGKKLKKNR